MVSKKTEEMFTRRAVQRLERKLASFGRDTSMTEDIGGIAEVAVRYFGDSAGEYLRKAAEAADALFSTKGTEHLNDPPEDDDEPAPAPKRQKEEVPPSEDYGEEFVDGNGVTVV